MLRVWLPLTKDLRNQGLDDVTVTNHGATFNSAGKLGGAYEFASGKRIQTTLPSTSNLNSKAISFACWVNISSWNSSYDCLMSIADGTYWNQSRATLCRNNTNSTLCWNIADGNTATRVYTTTSLSTNTWYHIACTYDGASLKIYVNGTLNNSAAATLSIGYAGTFNIGGWSGNNYPINCKMNDIRIYSHCLSPMEVKELAKGLVLHYPLNRQGWGQENLMPNSVEMPVGSSNASTGTWRLAGSSQMTRSRIAITDSPVGSSAYGFQSVGLQTGQDASCWGIDSFPRENGTTYTLSVWGRIVGGSTTAAMLGFSVYSGTTLSYGGTYGPAASSESKYYGSGAYDYAGGQLNPNGSWTRIYRTFTSTSTSGNIYIGFNTAKTGNNVTLQLCGVKLEKGDKMTPWIPNSDESMYTTLGLNGTTEYDCSGFCNNGTRTGTFSWTSDTPKYGVSTHIGSTSSKIHISNFPTSGFGNTYSFAWWGKRNSNSPMFWGFSDGIRLNGMYTGTLWNTGDGSNNPIYKPNTTTTITAPSLNVWHHYIMTGDGSACKLYVDGELYGQAKTYKAISGTSIYINGWNSGTSYCSDNTDMSDFRIYATALSPTDVKSLYQNCATIDPDGTIRGQIRS